MAVVNGYGQTSILDIRQRDFALSIVDEIRDMLSPAKGQEKRLPTLLLYNERGLRLFEDITYLDEYYLTNAEIEILKRNADHIAEDVQAGSLVVELGSGYGVPAVQELVVSKDYTPSSMKSSDVGEYKPY